MANPAPTEGETSRLATAALTALVRLLARQAAREALAGGGPADRVQVVAASEADRPQSITSSTPPVSRP
jgi:hypothetical protein